MKNLFTTTLTSERHRKLGYCEMSDFANLELKSLSKEEKLLIVKFYIDQKEIEYIEYNNDVYIKINYDNNGFHFSTEENIKWSNKQGKFSEKTAIQLMLKLRESIEKTYSNVCSEKYLLINKTLYYRYCKRSELNITICGNLAFSCWLSINMEKLHDGKNNTIATPANLLKIIKEEKIRFNKAKNNSYNVDNHILFSAPKNVKWGVEMNNN